MIPPLIKICGIRDAAFARHAEAAGADYLGFIFARESPRSVTPSEAQYAIAALTGSARRVGVFTHTPAEKIIAIAAKVPLDIAQLHSREYCSDEIARLKSAGLEVWALAAQGAPLPAGADAILLDGSDGTRSGGTGRIANWSRAAELSAAGLRVVLAGGISATNAVRAWSATGCAVLDVNSSLERRPGEKSVELMKEFFAAVSKIDGR